ncbi:hypothetical protein [Paenibacillus agilis]|uniref:Uncharacterized protein n=1 Tax=Paenibacillus agilis TaxID=3020863 RepID=A0A559IXA2_9BACL|nr:hypothetical protein [Paenibacillus agilis]TVX92249.1 hypothetical protein FPZ44_03740 [Paenibacillus agilis]
MDQTTIGILEQPSGKQSMLYASRLMKGKEVREAVQSFKAHANSRQVVQEIYQKGGLNPCLR